MAARVDLLLRSRSSCLRKSSAFEPAITLPSSPSALLSLCTKKCCSYYSPTVRADFAIQIRMATPAMLCALDVVLPTITSRVSADDQSSSQHATAFECLRLMSDHVGVLYNISRLSMMAQVLTLVPLTVVMLAALALLPQMMLLPCLPVDAGFHFAGYWLPALD